MAGKPLSAEEQTQIVGMYVDLDMRFADIAEVFDCSIVDVIKTLKRYGVVLKGITGVPHFLDRWDPDLIERVLDAYYNSNKTLYAICQQEGEGLDLVQFYRLLSVLQLPRRKVSRDHQAAVQLLEESIVDMWLQGMSVYKIHAQLGVGLARITLAIRRHKMAQPGGEWKGVSLDEVETIVPGAPRKPNRVRNGEGRKPD